MTIRLAVGYTQTSLDKNNRLGVDRVVAGRDAGSVDEFERASGREESPGSAGLSGG